MPMVDLKGQYEKVKGEILKNVESCFDHTQFINGPAVKDFEENLKTYLGVEEVISCGNGTDALQIALMALGLKPGDEVICPAFTYVATAEVIGLLNLKPIMADVCLDTFNISLEGLENQITSKTKVIVPVHLYGQASNMQEVMQFAKKHNLFVVEDAAQALSANYRVNNENLKKVGTIGDIGCTSFFPSKNLGCFGDGGALFTNNKELAKKIRMIANHGQGKKYYHEVIGCNSRLDTVQAIVLNAKLKHLDDYSIARQKMANFYNSQLGDIDELIIPSIDNNSSHVYHQYTLRVLGGQRDDLKLFLESKGVPSMIYYPLPLYKQNAFKNYVKSDFKLKNTELLTQEVLSIPIHTEFNIDHANLVVSSIREFYGKMVEIKN